MARKLALSQDVHASRRKRFPPTRPLRHSAIMNSDSAVHQFLKETWFLGPVNSREYRLCHSGPGLLEIDSESTVRILRDASV